MILTDRPIEKVREEVIDALVFNYSHGEITQEAFERRLDQAMTSDNHEEIVALAADLPLETDENYQSKKQSDFNFEYAPQPTTGQLRLNTILGSSERKGNWIVPKHTRIFNLLGSTELDFSQASFSDQHVEIELLCVLGSVEIKVPEGVNVVCETSNLLGSVENSSDSIASSRAPVIHVKGAVCLGSIEVEMKRSIKERFVSFANELKAMFGKESHKH